MERNAREDWSYENEFKPCVKVKKTLFLFVYITNKLKWVIELLLCSNLERRYQQGRATYG